MNLAEPHTYNAGDTLVNQCDCGDCNATILLKVVDKSECEDTGIISVQFYDIEQPIVKQVKFLTNMGFALPLGTKALYHLN